jgi:hypothetical protein
MKVLQFAFGGRLATRRTAIRRSAWSAWHHDNDRRRLVRRTVGGGRRVDLSEPQRPIAVRLVARASPRSPTWRCLFAAQDVLGLNSEARMNTPGGPRRLGVAPARALHSVGAQAQRGNRPRQLAPPPLSGRRPR